MELFKTFPTFMDIYLFSQILRFTYNSIIHIKKLSRRHLINSSDVFIIKGFTVDKLRCTLSVNLNALVNYSYATLVLR